MLGCDNDKVFLIIAKPMIHQKSKVQTICAFTKSHLLHNEASICNLELGGENYLGFVFQNQDYNLHDTNFSINL